MCEIDGKITKLVLRKEVISMWQILAEDKWRLLWKT